MFKNIINKITKRTMRKFRLEQITMDKIFNYYGFENKNKINVPEHHIMYVLNCEWKYLKITLFRLVNRMSKYIMEKDLKKVYYQILEYYLSRYYGVIISREIKIYRISKVSIKQLYDIIEEIERFDDREISGNCEKISRILKIKIDKNIFKKEIYNNENQRVKTIMCSIFNEYKCPLPRRLFRNMIQYKPKSRKNQEYIKFGNGEKRQIIYLPRLGKGWIYNKKFIYEFGEYLNNFRALRKVEWCLLGKLKLRHQKRICINMGEQTRNKIFQVNTELIDIACINSDDIKYLKNGILKISNNKIIKYVDEKNYRKWIEKDKNMSTIIIFGCISKNGQIDIDKFIKFYQCRLLSIGMGEYIK